jgi:hypothetical protein
LDTDEKVVLGLMSGCAFAAAILVLSAISVVGLFVYGLGRVVGAW